jgi:hypothetical protein
LYYFTVDGVGRGADVAKVFVFRGIVDLEDLTLLASFPFFVGGHGEKIIACVVLWDWR